jgi:hypothetical protein
MYLSRAHDSHDLAVSPVMLAPHYNTMKFVVVNLMTAP